jgi:hypothetical protein
MGVRIGSATPLKTTRALPQCEPPSTVILPSTVIPAKAGTHEHRGWREREGAVAFLA